MNKPYKQKVSVSLDEDIITKIKELADNDDRSFSQYINLVLKEHIARLKEDSEQEKGITPYISTSSDALILFHDKIFSI